MCIRDRLGIAATRNRGVLRVFAPVVGLLAAMALHAMWNSTALLGSQGALTLYFLLQMPLFGVAAAFAAWTVSYTHLDVYKRQG